MAAQTGSHTKCGPPAGSWQSLALAPLPAGLGDDGAAVDTAVLPVGAEVCEMLLFAMLFDPDGALMVEGALDGEGVEGVEDVEGAGVLVWLLGPVVEPFPEYHGIMASCHSG